ncbi:MAG TPA: hypothetical protein VF771_07150 [Longimicrobiaceae bacterium]
MKTSDTIPERARAERLDVIRNDLLRRMRPLCAGMPEDLFIELVESMAAVQLKYEMRDAPATGTSLQG